MSKPQAPHPFARLAASAVLAAAPLCSHAVVTLSTNVNGNTAADITAAINSFRGAIGGANNGGAPASFGSGRREINWDGVPDSLADPNLLPGNFFNANIAGRGRGVVFSTPGSGFMVSANAGVGPTTGFGFPVDFVPFSAQRMFSPIGSVITDVSFFSPSDQTTAAASMAFGAVFEDVEQPGLTTLQFFGAGNVLLHSISVATGASNSLSFAGAVFDSAQVTRVRITTGDAALMSNGVEGPGLDGVAMDDFIYGEPQPIPEPGTWLLMAGGLALLAGLRRRRDTAA